MRKPRLGEGSLGAVIGAVVGAVGGLIAVALPFAIKYRDIQLLSEARTIGIIGFMVSAPLGWFIGGQIGPRLEGKFSERTAGIIGGILGGMIPVGALIFWGWRMVAR
jgi:hypothetical protein